MSGPLDHIDHFARNYTKRAAFLSIDSSVSPSVTQIKHVIEDFERTGFANSPSGTTAEILAQWCKRCGANFVLIYHATFKVWAIKKVPTDDELGRILGVKP